MSTDRFLIGDHSNESLGAAKGFFFTFATQWHDDTLIMGNLCLRQDRTAKHAILRCKIEETNDILVKYAMSKNASLPMLMAIFQEMLIQCTENKQI